MGSRSGPPLVHSASPERNSRHADTLYAEVIVCVLNESHYSKASSSPSHCFIHLNTRTVTSRHKKANLLSLFLVLSPLDFVYTSNASLHSRRLGMDHASCVCLSLFTFRHRRTFKNFSLWFSFPHLHLSLAMTKSFTFRIHFKQTE